MDAGERSALVLARLLSLLAGGVVAHHNPDG
jgi:hypothetical protein